MAVKYLESLVLVGSTVLRGGKAGNPRMGTSYSANGKTPEIRTSMRHPSRSAEQEFQPAPRPGHADYLRVDALAVLGAGRSLRCAGVLSRSGVSDPTTSSTLVSTKRAVVRGSRIAEPWCKRINRMLPASTWGFGVR
ncbi:MAG: hypothetical protein ACRELF_10920 [Gemmataceae bacterium]